MDLIIGSVDLVRIVFLVGAVLALLCKKRFGVTPGGIIVPGILACLLFASFITFFVTLFSGYICWLAYKYILSNYALSNRWTSLLLVGISVVLSLIELAVIQKFRLLNQETIYLGMIVPGLVAISAKKYGLNRVMLSTLSVTALTFISGWAISLLVPYGVLSVLSVRLAEFTPLTLPNPFVALPISLIMALLTYYRFGIRGGGYLIAPFFAVVALTCPIQAALILLGVALSFLTVLFVQKYTLIIGLERFVLSLFCGYFVVTLMDVLAISAGIAEYRPAPLILIIAVAVMTNDLSLQPLRASIIKGLTPAYLVSILTRWAL